MAGADFDEAVEELKSRPTSKDDITIDPVKKALEELGKPDEDYSVVLVGGTNGKGSTVEMISELLHSQEKDVGITKSPHLVSVRERIKHNGEMISRENFLNLYEQINSLEVELSFFEFIVVMAYLYFSKRNTDYAVMEVGLGGKLDATNAAEPELSVITNVAEDHMKVLGDSIEEIAEEKAGIIPENGKIITDSELEPVVSKAEYRGSQHIKPVELEEKKGKYSYRGQVFKLPVDGSFQKQNMENALKAVEELEQLPENIEEAVSDLKCPGRMEVIEKEPKVILDGAHNPAALRKTSEDLPKETVCVFNAIETKEAEKMMKAISNNVSKFILTESEVDWSMETEKLSNICPEKHSTNKKPVEALQEAKNKGKPVLVTGSLYLIGNIKEKIETNEKQEIELAIEATVE